MQKVQLEISQQQGAAADGEELPNISVSRWSFFLVSWWSICRLE